MLINAIRGLSKKFHSEKEMKSDFIKEHSILKVWGGR